MCQSCLRKEIYVHSNKMLANKVWLYISGCKEISTDLEANRPEIYFNRKQWKMVEMFWIYLHMKNCIKVGCG